MSAAAHKAILSGMGVMLVAAIVLTTPLIVSTVSIHLLATAATGLGLARYNEDARAALGNGQRPPLCPALVLTAVLSGCVLLAATACILCAVNENVVASAVYALAAAVQGMYAYRTAMAIKQEFAERRSGEVLS